jgi:hypothetical protein
MKRLELFEILRSQEQTLAFIQTNGLIPTTHNCTKCGAIKIITELKNYRCNNRINFIKCSRDNSILNNTFFENSKISIEKILYILYEWCKDTPNEKCAEEYECSITTISNWYKKFQDFAINIFNSTQNLRIGGDNIIVQIDETCLMKNKYHRGRLLRSQKWIFGGIVLGNHELFFFEYVERRNENTLLEIIRRRILPGTIIMSDMWGGYQNLENRLSEYNYRHFTVNHGEYFIDPITGANTQSIEAFWSVIKRKLRKAGTNLGNFSNVEAKIKENLFKKNIR